MTIHFSRRYIVGPSGPKAIEMGRAKKKANKGKWYVRDGEGIGESTLFDSGDEALVEYKRRCKTLLEMRNR